MPKQMTFNSIHRNTKLLRLSTLFSLSLLITPATTSASNERSLVTAPPSSTLIESRQLYREALEQLKLSRSTENIATTLSTTRKALKDYPLLSHLDYVALSQAPEKLTPKLIESRMPDSDDQLYAYRLHKQRLQWLFKKSDWQGFSEHYRLIPDHLSNLRGQSDVACQYATARYRLGEPQQALESAKQLWNTPRSMPTSCDSLFHILQSNGGVTESLAWQRYTSAFANNKMKLANYLKRFLGDDDHNLAVALEQAYQSPKRLDDHWESLSQAILTHPELDNKKRSQIAVTLIQRLARSDANHAATFVTANAPFSDKRFINDPQHDSNIRDYIIQRQALSDYADVDDLHKQLGSPLTDANLSWLLRAAIAQADWRKVIALTDKAPDELKSSDRWQYWSLRARHLLEELSEEEQIAFQQLAMEANFYGFSAAHWLGLPASIAPLTDVPSQDAISQLLDVPALRRASEHYIHGNIAEANHFWNRSMRQIQSDELIPAAYFASQLGWHSQAIGTAARKKAWQFYEIRFPDQYSEAFSQAATRYQQPPQWFYATARQESALAPQAVSGAGAVGLMQVLPSTAKQVAGKLSLPYHRSMLSEPEYSIRIGSAYLDHLYQRFGSRVLSSAAYNAGPRRVNDWLQKMPNDLPVDAWIETIVFSETRQYVQNILSFATIHQLLQSSESATVASLPLWPAFNFYEPNELVIGAQTTAVAQR